MRLRALELELELEHPGHQALRQAVLAALLPHGRPLRWAITRATGGKLGVEAVVLEAEMGDAAVADAVPLPPRSSAGGL